MKTLTIDFDLYKEEIAIAEKLVELGVFSKSKSDDKQKTIQYTTINKETK